MDIDKYNREQAELERKKREEAKAAYKLKPGEYICPRCKDYIIDSERRFHPCSREGVTVPAVYFPNVGKLTKNADPAYRKHAGSRPLEKVMKAKVKANSFRWATTPFQNIPA